MQRVQHLLLRAQAQVDDLARLRHVIAQLLVAARHRGGESFFQRGQVLHQLRVGALELLHRRAEALAHAAKYGRDLDAARNDTFVGMYVNDWTLDFGDVGREAIATLLRRGYEAGVIPRPVELEFIG